MRGLHLGLGMTCGAPAVSTPNLLTFGEALDNAAWTKNGVTVTANATNAPNGTATADLVTEDGTTAPHYINRTYTKAASALPLCYSVYLKPNGRTKWRQYFSSGLGNFTYAEFDLSGAGSIITPVTNSGMTTPGAGIALDSNGFYRLYIAATTDADTSLLLQLVALDGTGAITYTGNGTSGLYEWGVKLEAGLTPGTY